MLHCEICYTKFIICTLHNEKNIVTIYIYAKIRYQNDISSIVFNIRIVLRNLVYLLDINIVHKMIGPFNPDAISDIKMQKCREEENFLM